MCGIFGFSLKTNGNRKTALLKFKIMGIYNMTRGRDSSGVFVNGEIKKGIGLHSDFDDFIEENVLPVPKENGIMLGHTRQGSPGYKKTIDEAHPFLINNNLVFTHNGTIKNVKELCEKYRIDMTNHSVDSQILATILEEDGPKEAFENYIGAAATAYTNLSEPNVLYLYHGKSKEYKHGQPIEERPLFYLETKDGIFYSSLENSLEAIRDSEEDIIYLLEYNAVYKIENGKFLLGETVKIDREEMNVITYATPVYSGKQSQTSMKMIGTSTNYSSNQEVFTGEQNLIKRESLPKNLIEAKEKTNLIYYHQGRYWEAPRKLLNGPIYIKKGGLFGSFDDSHSELCFFWSGAWLKDKYSFEELTRMNQMMDIRNWVRYPSEHNYAMMLSRYSKFPLTNIGLECLSSGNFYRDQWYSNGNTCKENNFTPKYANGRNYKIKDGFLVKISASQREKTLYPTIDFAFSEIENLMKNKPLGISGGGSQDTPFLSSRSTIITETTRAAEEENELVYFFDVSPFTRLDIQELIGDSERDAMRKFCQQIHKTEWDMVALPEEVETIVDEMFEDAIIRKCSILDTIKEDMDKQRLMNCYDEVLQKQRDEMRSSIDKEIQSKFAFKEDDQFTGQITDDMTREEVLEKIEEGINYMEDIQNVSMELIDEQDSDLAQDCGGYIITDINNMLANLQAVLLRHNEDRLANRIKKIRETKSMVNGTL